MRYSDIPANSQILLWQSNLQFSLEERKEVERLLREEFTKDYEPYLVDYLSKRIRLSEYLRIPLEDRAKLMQTPEIGIPGTVKPEMIRLNR